MAPPLERSTAMYRVVVNDEEQYSIWPDARPLPSGWHAEGTTGDKDACLRHIETVWTDMRPRSLRERQPASRPA
ncbi:MbtH family protein [Streptomyces massasporeus]|uniref:MbtH family protein n=1 Tax=Streptomyces massasporeus TaxID=67324 RepID=UPI0033A3B54A